MTTPSERDYVDPRSFLEAVLDIQEAEGMAPSPVRELIPRLPVDLAREMAMTACAELATYRRLVAERDRARPKK